MSCSLATKIKLPAKSLRPEDWLIIEVLINRWPVLRPLCPRISQAVDQAQVGSYTVVPIT